jgi:peptidoglycan/xylan/chitin deacetylase (PgdA/CDA1 family)
MPGKKDLLATALRYSGANQMLGALGAWRGLVVLNYHRIGDPAGTDFDRGVFSGTADEFRTQLRTVSRHCDVVAIKDLDQALHDRRGRYALITFDDGYRDNYALAYPVLRELRLPATFFLTTSFLDEQRVAWWDDVAWMVRHSPRSGLSTSEWMGSEVPFETQDREAAVDRLLRVFKKLPWDKTGEFLQFVAAATGSGRCPRSEAADLWMTWDMVREMRRGGMDIGGHTVSHPILARLSREGQQHEINASKERIESELGEPIEAFSYPVGAPDCFNATTFDCLERAGYRFAFSFHGGFTTVGEAQRFDIPRFPISPGLTTTRLQALLTLPQVFAKP